MEYTLYIEFRDGKNKTFTDVNSWFYDSEFVQIKRTQETLWYRTDCVERVSVKKPATA